MEPTKPPTTPEFFADMRDWSERKVRLITKYVDGFVRILSDYPLRYYVDGFAGAGVYDDGARGSSLRIADLAVEMDAANRPYRLRCINIEDDKDNFARLEACTRDHGDAVVNRPGTFSDNIDFILTATAGSPLVAFLDPFGAKGIEWNIVKRLLARSSPTDVFIRFDQRTLGRLAGNMDSSSRDAAAKVKVVADTYGTSDRDLLAAYFHGDSAEERVRSCIAAYTKLLVKEMSKARGRAFAGACPIESAEYGNKYHLVFATGSEMGLRLLSDLVFGEDKILSGDKAASRKSQSGQLGLFGDDEFAALDDNQLDIALERDIMSLVSGKTVTRAHIRNQVIMNGWFGRAGKSHYTRVLKVMMGNGAARLVSGTPGRDEAVFEVTGQANESDVQDGPSASNR